MTAAALTRLAPFATWIWPARATSPAPDTDPREDGVRREYLTNLMSSGYHGCGSETGAMALMAMFPHDF